MSRLISRELLKNVLISNLNQKSKGIATRFNFDTYKLVRQLERNGFTRGQAVALMRTMNAFLVDSSLSVRQELISANDLENETYLQKSHLQELRNELSDRKSVV